ncbi:MAG: hypothetical protein AAGB05_00185 [Pseudomonadota bacterium]
MSYDRGLPIETLVARRAECQARADLLDAAECDFARRKRCAMALERALLQWLIRHRVTFADRFNTHALLRRLPLKTTAEADKAACRLRARLTYSETLRRAVIQAVSERRRDLAALALAETQLTVRLHTRAFALASEHDWEIVPLDAARAARDSLLAEHAETTADEEFAAHAPFSVLEMPQRYEIGR